MTFYSQNLDGSNENNSAPPHPRIRKEGGGRKKLIQREPKLLSALEALVEQRLVVIQKTPYAGPV